jgi:integrase/recombinase XerD
MWLRSARIHSGLTRKVYVRDSSRFASFVDKPLRSVTVGDLQRFADSLLELAPATQGRILSAIKSLLNFAHKIGYTAFNVGVAVGIPSRKDDLAARIMTAEQVIAMITLEPKPRNRALLRLAYGAGLRVSETVGLSWCDLQERDDGEAQATVYGKGGKTRVVLLSAATWRELSALKGEVGPDAPVFVSRSKRHRLTTMQVWRIVKAAATRAGVVGNVSPHWLRHAAASHALDAGATLATVRDGLGHSSAATTSRYLHAKPRDGLARYLKV